ncbi:MAG: hypothetical protein ACI9TF_001901 [Paracrocinitomix sp.]|jgi:hypothetical protein
MNRTIASLTQWVGRLTVLIAFIFLIWSVADLASESSGPGLTRVSLGPNQYLQALVSSTSIAVSGMLSLGIGMMLERFNDE